MQDDNERTVSEMRATMLEYSGKQRGSALLELVADLSFVVALLNRERSMRDGLENSELLLQALQAVGNRKKHTDDVQRDIAPKVLAVFRDLVRKAARDLPHVDVPDLF